MHQQGTQFSTFALVTLRSYARSVRIEFIEQMRNQQAAYRF